MREPSLQKTTLLSFILHLSIFLIAIIFLKQSNYIHVTSPYTVNLVSPDVLTGMKKEKSVNIFRNTEKSSQLPVITEKEMSRKEIYRDQEIIEDKIAAIAAKKKIEKIVKLRSIISLKADNDNPKTSSLDTSNRKGLLFDGYYSKISREIWQQWVYPDIGRKDIEAIISIKILKDGTAIVQGIEKSSGNALFDRSAIRALAKASPLSPPPYEMEIGVRFYP
jgi:colicin import membrane protein